MTLTLLLEYRCFRMDAKTAFAPAHVTGLFYINDSDENPLRKGSLGAGFSIDHGAYSTVRRLEASSAPRYSINGREVSAKDLPVSRSVLRRYEPFLRGKGLQIEHRIDAPQGSGFGSSGAGALSLTLSLNDFTGRPFSTEEAAGIAHTAEIEHKTGLGTVIGEYYGGFEIRIEAGAPGFGRIEPIAFEDKLSALFVVFGPYSTSEALSDPSIRRRINRLGSRLHAELLASPTVESFLQLSHEFSISSGLLTERARQVMELFEKSGYTGGMLMFGDAVYTLAASEEIALLGASAGSRFLDAEVFTSAVNGTGARLV